MDNLSAKCKCDRYHPLSHKYPGSHKQSEWQLFRFPCVSAPQTDSIYWAIPKFSMHFFCILHMMDTLFVPFNAFFFSHCLLDTKKGSSWRSRYWSNSTQGAHSLPVTDARYLWDNGLMKITYEKDSVVGLQRILLQLQHYWVISPLPVLEHKNGTVKRTCKELGCMVACRVILIADPRLIKRKYFTLICDMDPVFSLLKILTWYPNSTWNQKPCTDSIWLSWERNLLKRKFPLE